MNHLTFRSSRIVYYGPHACNNCGAMICKMGFDFGGNAFTYPEGPIYPNTEWHPHVCDPKAVQKFKQMEASRIPAEPPTQPPSSSSTVSITIDPNCIPSIGVISYPTG